MKSFCRHTRYVKLDHIFEPRYSTKDALINVDKITDTEHYLLKFSKAASYPNWLYFNRKDIVKRPTQGNGRGRMYVLPLSVLQDFSPIKDCNCEQSEFDLFK